MNKLAFTTHGFPWTTTRAVARFLLTLETAGFTQSLVQMPSCNADGSIVAVVDCLTVWRQLTEADRDSRSWHAVDVDDVERLQPSHRRFRRHHSIGAGEAILWGRCSVSGARVEFLPSLPVVAAQHDDEELIAVRVSKHCVPQGINVSLADRSEKWWTVEEYEHDYVLIDTFLPTDEWDEYDLDVPCRVEADHENGRRYGASLTCQAHCRELKPGLLLATFVPFEEQRSR
jgi:hypothetical protein